VGKAPHLNIYGLMTNVDLINSVVIGPRLLSYAAWANAMHAYIIFFCLNIDDTIVVVFFLQK